MRKKITVALLSLITIFTISAQNEITSKELNEIQIEATRTKIYPDANRIVKIIEKTEIEKLAVQNLDELLDRIAGLDARQRGAGGVQADLSIRGGSFDQVLILLNGVNITDPQTGHYNLDVPLALNDISRIEILQGSAARMYGPNAFSGAINIITSETNKSFVKNQNEAGSYGFLSESVSGNYYTETFQTFASASYKQSDGFIKNTDYKTTNTFWQTKINTKNTGFFRFQLGAQFKKYGANSFYTPLLPYQFEDTKSFLSSLEWNYSKNFYTLNTQFYWREHFDKFIFDRYAAAIKANYHKSDITGGKITTNLDWKNYGKTTIGFDIRNEHIFSNKLGTLMETPIQVPFEKDSVYYTKHDNRSLATIIIDHNINAGKWNFAGGLSTTFNKKFGMKINEGFDIAYKFNKSTHIFTALNTAFRLPTFTDLYYETSTHTSNPNLKPEKSLTFEFGGKYSIENLSFDAVTYYRWGKNVIDWVRNPDSINAKWQSKNLTNVNAFGADINSEYKFDNFIIKNIHIAYSFLNLDKKAEGYDSEYALDYLKNKFVFGLNHKIWNKLSADWNLSWYERGGTYTEKTQLYDYKPYTLLNTRLLWNSKNIDIHFDINNILNQKYVEFGGLKQPRVNFITGITLKI